MTTAYVGVNRAAVYFNVIEKIHHSYTRVDPRVRKYFILFTASPDVSSVINHYDIKW